MLAALLKSIELNHLTGEQINVWIVEDSVSDKNKYRLESSIESNLFTFHWIAAKLAVPPHVQLPLDHNSYPTNIFMRLFIPYFIPPHINKVLYMDVDMIMERDISELWKHDISNYILGAVTDPICVYLKNSIANYKELHLPPNAKYYNSGLLLINKTKWLENNLTIKVIESISKNRKYAHFSDQYGLNVNTVDQWLELDPLWNYYTNGTHPHPYVIHFFHRKPFYKSYFNNPYYQKIFYAYLDQTRWKGSPKVGEIKRYYIKSKNVLGKAPLLLKQIFH